MIFKYLLLLFNLIPSSKCMWSLMLCHNCIVSLALKDKKLFPNYSMSRMHNIVRKVSFARWIFAKSQCCHSFYVLINHFDKQTLNKRTFTFLKLWWELCFHKSFGHKWYIWGNLTLVKLRYMFNAFDDNYYCMKFYYG